MLLNKSKIAVITGASSGIAKAIEEQISLNHLIIKHRLRPSDGYIHGDLSKENDAKNLFKEINSIDLLICCAGGVNASQNKRAEINDCFKISGEDVVALFERNFLSAFYTCKYAIPKMKINSNIIFIGSDVVFKPRNNGHLGIYGATKAALHTYTVHLANQLKNQIKVNCVATDGNDIDLLVLTVKNFILSEETGVVRHLRDSNIVT